MDSSRQIEARAAVWLARQDSGEWGEREQAELDQWLKASTHHYVAYIRLEAAWERSRRLKALNGGNGVPATGQWQFSPFFERADVELHKLRARPAVHWGLAAGLLLALGAGAFWAKAAFEGERYVTPVGGVSIVPMVDGSKITLATNSEVRVILDDSERRVRLEQGEAFFDVSKDPQRPFVVDTGHQRVTVLGTKFSVRRDAGALRVIVTEGLVRLGAGTELPAGSIAQYGAQGTEVHRITLQQAEEYLSWREGYLVFNEVALKDAVAEFNRYNARKLAIEDSAIGSIEFSGKLRCDSVEAFARLLETGFPVDARREGQRIVLKSRSGSSAAQ